MPDKKITAPLDLSFEPMIQVYQNFVSRAEKSGGNQIIIGIERTNGYVSTHKMTVFRDGSGHDEENYKITERVVKTMLWIHGGYKIIIAGSEVIYKMIKDAYSENGLRDFDRVFMSRVYEKPFEVVYCDIEKAPSDVESSASFKRHLDGCRIGFDAGGSDRKVSAVVDGVSIFSEEVVWFPKTNSDPHYHIDGIREAMKTAASKMPRVDGIGVSTAGVTIDNKIMISSLFLKVPENDFDKYVKNIYIDIAKEMGDVPIEVANDGDVTALAGAMSLEDTKILGVAMGTSEAGGYVDRNGNITGWLNELAFVPVDFNDKAMVDEWSGDYGCGVKYFSQDGIIKLTSAAGIDIEESLSPAEKLKVVQTLMENSDKRAELIYETIGVYFGYGAAYYSLFYDIKHILLMGRVTSGEGGNILLKKAKEVLENVYPELAKKINVQLPDEKSRRVGQSIAAASLPFIGK